MDVPRKTSFTPGELLFSIALVCMSALALAMSVLEFQTSELASKTTLGVVKLDQALAHELIDLRNFSSESVKASIREGHAPRDLVFHVATSGGVVNVSTGTVVTLDRAFQVCSGYPIGECGYKIRLSFEAHPPSFSYEVSSSYPEAALKIERSGRNEVVIPRAAYRDPMHVACDLRHEVGLSGLVSSDRYDCIGRPMQACPRGTLPKALIVDKQTHTLELDCGAPSKIARCPAFYALNRVNTRALDGTEAKEAECVRTTASVAAPSHQPDPGLRLVGRACPQGYRSESSCTLVNVKSQPGKCGTGVAKPVAGRLRFVENKPIGTVDCGVDIQNQTCGAVWTASAALKIKCVLDQPEFAHAL